MPGLPAQPALSDEESEAVYRSLKAKYDSLVLELTDAKKQYTRLSKKIGELARAADIKEALKKIVDV